MEALNDDGTNVVVEEEVQNGDIIDIEKLEEDNVQAIYNSLVLIFPDADDAFLRRVSIDHSLDTTSLNLCVEGLLKHKNYPKKVVVSQAVDPRTDILHRHSPRHFLEKFEDPAKYFSERNVGEHFLEFSINYLKAKFECIGVRAIKTSLKLRNSNLTLAYEYLCNYKADRSTKRSKNEMSPYAHCTDQKFLDEVFFLDNKEEILKLVSEKEQSLKLRFEKAKLNKELLECQCCFNDEVLSSDVVTCIEGHVFCKICVKRSVEICFGDGKTTFDCLCECDSQFRVETLKDILSNGLYEKIQSKIQESEVKSADITGIYFCPSCEYAEILVETEKVFTCKRCEKEFCRFCQEESHIPLRCEEYLEEKNKNSARIQIENKMTEALLRECYRCKKKFIKLDGCNKMQCVCGALMCYICRQPVVNYTHFDQNQWRDPRQPSTSNQTAKCPLWSNNSKLHLDAVIEAARIATAQVEKDNPAVHIEPKELLKGLKRKLP